MHEALYRTKTTACIVFFIFRLATDSEGFFKHGTVFLGCMDRFSFAGGRCELSNVITNVEAACYGTEGDAKA